MLLELAGSAPPVTAAVPATGFDTPFAQLLPDPAAQVTAIAEYEAAATQALPAATGPAIVQRHVTEIHVGIRYQVPSFPKPRQKECCCGGRP